jgi:hypothetical protein
MLGPNPAANHDAAQENDDRDHRRGHEEEDELFAVQLDLVEAVVRRCH